MLAMEAAENAVDFGLTGGVCGFSSPMFWSSAGLAMGESTIFNTKRTPVVLDFLMYCSVSNRSHLAAGFFVPLPYNYWRLRKHGRSCH